MRQLISIGSLLCISRWSFFWMKNRNGLRSDKQLINNLKGLAQPLPSHAVKSYFEFVLTGWSPDGWSKMAWRLNRDWLVNTLIKKTLWSAQAGLSKTWPWEREIRNLQSPLSHWLVQLHIKIRQFLPKLNLFLLFFSTKFSKFDTTWTQSKKARPLTRTPRCFWQT